uniref:Splicing factor YJU2 n=1 Tax=Phaeomonas parva TaxID=124430 RepID=A0A7S1U8M7_9STRA|mmetsp:Transcript_36788/g.115199  ORF Transcript_36788/g.115199 Transcript_36788/m.115199 type:complete len:300 (+) Transcript_36788:122-1021(+)|eukprot:CAMPEP_0118867808 /NCGR_PEP_ID=MMETSP1163-20130328/11273_1 /TAXON_ID=124430 /ORGANISM="Phaeomonas parva, Strain CCMP2877" /LENGTH=299 /DNA_ID=CAMNT_0006802265 /DNA_START=74 /DNA_END=973 /DNA_ORIENTATION=-
MGERKVIQQYFAPDFDPSKIPKKKRQKFNKQESRIMLPFSLQCNTCHEFMYQGKKFNAMKEDIDGEEGRYLGIQRYRFSFKCAMCRAPIAFATDPKNTDWVMEYGATRNFEAWKAKNQAEEAEVAAREAEEKGDAMKALENRTLDSKLELEILDSLEHIQALNKRNEVANARVDTDAILDRMDENRKRKAGPNPDEKPLDDEDEELVRTTVFRRVSKIDDALEPAAPSSASATSLMPPPKAPERAKMRVRKVVKKKGGAKPKAKAKPKPKAEAKPSPPPAPAAPSMGSLLGYSDSSDSD